MTLRHALASLEQRGLLARRVGRDGGTFVAEPKLELTGLAGLSDQLRILATVLKNEEGLTPVWNWQQNGVPRWHSP